MRTATIAVVVVLATLVTVAAPSAGAHCSWDSRVYDVAGRAYIVEYGFLPPGSFIVELWIYAESNGRAGLQRGGESLLGDADPCGHDPDPDLIVF